MDSVICLVDALYFKQSFRQQEEVHRQIAMADLVLLNKAGDVDEKSLTVTRINLQSLNPYVEIIQTNHADIRHRQLLGRYAYRADHIASYRLIRRVIY